MKIYSRIYLIIYTNIEMKKNENINNLKKYIPKYIPRCLTARSQRKMNVLH